MLKFSNFFKAALEISFVTNLEASNKLILFLAAIFDIDSILFGPIDLFGVFIILSKLISSLELFINCRYAIKSFISFLSKNPSPPNILYGILFLCNASSKALDCAFVL